MGPEPNRRRAAVRWTSSADEGDAAEAVAELDAWLARHDAEPGAWDDLLGRVRDGLLGLTLEPGLMSDPQARAILHDLADTPDPEGLDLALDALLARADAVAQAHAAGREPQRLIGLDGRRPGPARSLFKV